MKRVLMLGVLVLLGLLAHAQAPHLFEHTYPVVQQEDPWIRQLMDRVSTDSLYATIDHLQNYHTRRWDSRMVYEAQDWLYSQYARLGLDSVYLHDFPVEFHDSIYQTSDNIIAFQRGTKYPNEYVVCGAHYDSFNNSPGDPDSLRSPGADDNASGTAGILETARLLSRCTFERSIFYCGWAAEEVGLVGSAAYAKDCADQLVDIVGYLNLDMIGYLEDGYDIHANLIYVRWDSTLANVIYSFGDVYFPEMPIRQSWMTSGDSDFSSFNRNGYPAVHIFEDTRHYSPFIHTTNDVLGVSVNRMDQVKRFTELNLGVVATLAGIVSNGVDEQLADGLTVYPNPVNETLHVKGVAMRQVEVYNVMGQQVVSQAVTGDECEIQVGALVSGIYFVRVLSNEGRFFIQKFVKE